jgi:hypothetical protein
MGLRIARPGRLREKRLIQNRQGHDEGAPPPEPFAARSATSALHSCGKGGDFFFRGRRAVRLDDGAVGGEQRYNSVDPLQRSAEGKVGRGVLPLPGQHAVIHRGPSNWRELATSSHIMDETMARECILCGRVRF